MRRERCECAAKRVAPCFGRCAPKKRFSPIVVVPEKQLMYKQLMKSEIRFLPGSFAVDLRQKPSDQWAFSLPNSFPSVYDSSTIGKTRSLFRLGIGQSGARSFPIGFVRAAQHQRTGARSAAT